MYIVYNISKSKFMNNEGLDFDNDLVKIEKIIK